MKRREIQLHVAATVMGDAFSVIESERKDVEIAQFAAAFPPEYMGMITSNMVDKAFFEFRENIKDRLRKAGLMKGGQ